MSSGHVSCTTRKRFNVIYLTRSPIDLRQTFPTDKQRGLTIPLIILSFPFYELSTQHP